MIYIKLNELEKLKNKILDWKEIINFDYKNAQLGKHVISNNCYIVILENEMMQKNVFECHKKYADLHIPLRYSEKIEFSNTDKNYKITSEYSIKDDVSLGNIEIEANWLEVNVQDAILFAPGEPHKPWLKAKKDDKDLKQRKAVVKILWT